MKDHTFELRRKIWRNGWSSQLYKQLSSCEIKAWKKKKFGPERDSNPWPLRYRCSALPTELSSRTVKFFQALISQLLNLCITAMIIYFLIKYLTVSHMTKDPARVGRDGENIFCSKLQWKKTKFWSTWQGWTCRITIVAPCAWKQHMIVQLWHEMFFAREKN